MDRKKKRVDIITFKIERKKEKDIKLFTRKESKDKEGRFLKPTEMHVSWWFFFFFQIEWKEERKYICQIVKDEKNAWKSLERSERKKQSIKETAE